MRGYDQKVFNEAVNYIEEYILAEPEKTLTLFAEEFRRGRILSGKKRIVVKEYPAEVAAALEESGFLREMQDYVLYR